MGKLTGQKHKSNLIKSFEAVRKAQVLTEEDFAKMTELKTGFSANQHGTFLLTAELVRARHEASSEIARSIGGDILHDKDVQDAIWEGAMQAVVSDPSQVGKIAHECLASIEDGLGAKRYIICQNELPFWMESTDWSLVRCKR